MLSYRSHSQFICNLIADVICLRNCFNCLTSFSIAERQWSKSVSVWYLCLNQGHIIFSVVDNSTMLVIVFTLFIITPSAVRGQGNNSQRWYKYKYRLGFKTKKTLGYVLVSFKRKQNGVILRIPVKENFISFSIFYCN